MKQVFSIHSLLLFILFILFIVYIVFIVFILCAHFNIPPHITRHTNPHNFPHSPISLSASHPNSAGDTNLNTFIKYLPITMLALTEYVDDSGPHVNVITRILRLTTSLLALGPLRTASSCPLELILF
jgi:hypothetical protein